MENKVIKVVGQNHQTFVAKLADINRRLSKKESKQKAFLKKRKQFQRKG